MFVLGLITPPTSPRGALLWGALFLIYAWLAASRFLRTRRFSCLVACAAALLCVWADAAGPLGLETEFVADITPLAMGLVFGWFLTVADDEIQARRRAQQPKRSPSDAV